MSESRPPIDLKQLRVRPLAQRRSLSSVEKIVVDPDSPPPPLPEVIQHSVDEAAQKVLAARRAGASVMLVYGAHLLRNGAALILDRMMDRGWLTHLATNGAGTIHDWEYAWLGKSTESVRENVAAGCFGTWEETGRNIHIALLATGVRGEGYGRGLGRFIAEDGVDLPEPSSLERDLVSAPVHPLAAARAELLRAMKEFGLAGGRYRLEHRWKHASILAAAFRHGISMTVHPGIGYDIITNHPMVNGAAIGRAAERDFALFSGSVEGLNGGVVFSIGSAIMGPQVFEKSLSCVNNLRISAGRPIVAGHSIYVVDLQDGGGWDWSRGEPPRKNPAYYLRFCKSYSRMGGQMRYVQCDNVAFIHNLFHRLSRS